MSSRSFASRNSGEVCVEEKGEKVGASEREEEDAEEVKGEEGASKLLRSTGCVPLRSSREEKGGKESKKPVALPRAAS